MKDTYNRPKIIEGAYNNMNIAQLYKRTSMPGIEISRDETCKIMLVIETSTGNINRTINVGSIGKYESSDIAIFGDMIANGYLLQGIDLRKIKHKNIVCTKCQNIIGIYNSNLRKNSSIMCRRCGKKGNYLSHKDVPREFQNYFAGNPVPDGILMVGAKK